MQANRVFLLAVSVLALSISASADVVKLKSGGSIEGTVVSESEEQLVLETAYGTVTFQLSDVADVEHSSPAEKKIRSELDGLAPSDVSSRLALAERARGQGLDHVARRIYNQVVAIDSDNAEARRALGYVWYEGEWVTPAEKEANRGLVPYRGRWVTKEEREKLVEEERQRRYFAQFGLTPSQGKELLERISDADLEIRQRGGYVVRLHVGTVPVREKPYFYSVDALSWKRLGAFVGVSFLDPTRQRARGFGELEIEIRAVTTDRLGNRKPGELLHSRTVTITPEMWDRKSDFKTWDASVNHATYEEYASDQLKEAWRRHDCFNYDGVLFVLANRDVELLRPPGVFYVRATLRVGEREREIGRYVQYAEAR